MFEKILFRGITSGRNAPPNAGLVQQKSTITQSVFWAKNAQNSSLKILSDFAQALSLQIIHSAAT